MPKLKSVAVTVEKLGKNGRMEKGIEQVYVPVDEAGWLEPIIEGALSYDLLIQDDGKTPHTLETLKAKQAAITEMFHKREIEANKRRAVL